MRFTGRRGAAVAAVLVALSSTVFSSSIVFSAFAATPSTNPAPTATGAGVVGTHAVPPPAPSPTDHANSPAAPDPHPPRGGIGPLGEAVGGARLLSRGLVVPAHAAAPPKDLTARAWIVVDLDDGAVVAARDPHGRYQPASIQKLLTTITLLPRLPGDRLVTVSRSAADTEGSHAGLVAGGRYTVDQLFRGLLLVSGNDAAAALADAAGGKATTVAAMNETAKSLGAYDTYVQTPSGLDGWQQLTSAYDMALFLRAALAQPRFVSYDTTLQATLPKQGAQHQPAVKLWNQNTTFLTTVHGALVAKTGYTDAAQHTFVGAISRGGHRYGVVLMRAQRWPDDQWVQATKLIDWAAGLHAAPVGQLDDGIELTAGDAASSTAGTATGSAANGSPSPSPTNTTSSANSGTKVIILVILVGGAILLAGRARRPPGGRGPRRDPRDPRDPRYPRGPSGPDGPPDRPRDR